METIDLLKLSGRDKKKFIQFALDLKNLPESKKKALEFPLYASEKYDGVFCIAWVHTLGITSGVSIYSRTGEIYTSMEHIEYAIGKLAWDKKMNEGDLIIFEAYSPGIDQPTISGYARDTKEQHPSLSAYCHDHLTLEEFVNGGGREFDERLKALYEILKDAQEPLHYVTHTPVNCGAYAMSMAKYIWKTGGEGIVLKNPRATYEGGKKNANNLKIKESVTYDLLVTGIKEGSGDFSGMVGSIQCRFKEGREITMSGLKRSQRIAWWADPSLIVGKIVEVRAMKDSTKGKLRELAFKSIREDKLEGDY